MSASRNRRGTRRRAAGLTIAAAVVLASSSCVSSAKTAAKPTITTTKSAAATATTLAPLPGCTDSNVTESFAPLSPLPAAGRMPDGSYMAEIQKRGRLVVGTAADVLLYAYRNPQTNKIE